MRVKAEKRVSFVPPVLLGLNEKPDGADETKEYGQVGWAVLQEDCNTQKNRPKG